jgi:hypothetical protein
LVQQRTELLPFGKNIVRRSIRSGALSIKKEDFEGLAAEGRAKMTVRHVHVAEGGHAIVGNVNAPTEGEARGRVRPKALM